MGPLRRGERRRVDKLSTVRIGSARYSVPRELIGRDVEEVVKMCSCVQPLVMDP